MADEPEKEQQAPQGQQEPVPQEAQVEPQPAQVPQPEPPVQEQPVEQPAQEPQPEPPAKKKRKRLSPEERRAMKQRQEELRRVAITAKVKQFYRVCHAVALLGLVGALAAYFLDFYPDTELPRSGYAAAYDVLYTGRAHVSSGQTLVRFHVERANAMQHLMALIPVGLLALLLLYLVDLVEPLGAVLPAASIVYSIAASIILGIGVASPGWLPLLKPPTRGFWAGVYGVSPSLVILGLLVFSVFALGAAPGARRRLSEYEGHAGAAVQTAETMDEGAGDAGKDGVPGGG